MDDRLRSIGLRNGALASKLSGAGNGGVMTSLGSENKERALSSLEKAGVKAFIPRISSGV